MTKIGVYEAKTHFSKLVDRVAGGERFTVTRHGVAVMSMQPVDSQPETPTKEVIEAIKSFRKERRLEGISIRALIEEGRL